MLPAFQQMILSSQLGTVEIITHWLFRSPLQELTFTRAHFSLKQSEIGMPFQDRSLPLLKVQRMVWLGLPLWWELGTNFPYHRSWWMNVIRRITSKNSDSDSEELLWFLAYSSHVSFLLPLPPLFPTHPNSFGKKKNTPLHEKSMKALW